MYLRQVSGRGHRTQEPYGSTFNGLPLSYSQAQTSTIYTKFFSLLSLSAISRAYTTTLTSSIAVNTSYFCCIFITSLDRSVSLQYGTTMRTNITTDRVNFCFTFVLNAQLQVQAAGTCGVLLTWAASSVRRVGPTGRNTAD